MLSMVGNRMIFSQSALPNIPGKVPIGEALWPFKHTIKQLNILAKGDPYTFASQYQQNPTPLGGNMFKDSYWNYYDILPPDIYSIHVYGDTAQKTKEINDYSVFQCWGKSRKGLYLIDQFRGKWEAPELESKVVEFWNKHKPSVEQPTGAQILGIEDKSSGSTLIQTLRTNYTIPVKAIQRNTDKVLRAMGIINYIASGYIHIPKGAPWLHDFKEEFRKFSPLMTHKHDDQIDPLMDAIEQMIIFDNNADLNNCDMVDDMHKTNDFNWE